MKRFFYTLVVLSIVSTLSAQTYVWKNGYPVLSDPDSITFVKPDMSAQVQEIKDKGSDGVAIRFLFLTKDYLGNPQWQSAMLNLTASQYTSKHVGKMAMYNHYTIMRADECPTAGYSDLQGTALTMGLAVVSADYEGFGETIDRPQAYCFGEANARASIDALLTAREWLKNEGYTLSDTIVNFGFSQGAQTTIAALKLSQTEYRDKVHFYKSIAGDGPYFSSLTYKKFIEWKKCGLSAALPLMVITLNELLQWGMDYKEVFIGKLGECCRMWFLSKKFNTTEASALIGTDSISQYMQPAYCDTTSQAVKHILSAADQLNITNDWTPDKDTNLKIYHSKADDVVPFENGREMFNFFQQQECNKVAIDSTLLNADHVTSGTNFGMAIMIEFSNL